MENKRVRTHEQADGLSSHAGSAGGPTQRPATDIAYAKMPQITGTMGTARPTRPSPATNRIRAHYTGSLC